MNVNDVLQNALAGISIGSTYGLIGLGVVFLWQSINRINFANISSAMLSAYLFYTFYSYLKFNFVISFFITIICIGIYGLLLRYMIYEPITKKGGARLEFVVATLMICVFWLCVINSIYGGLPKPFPPVFGEAKDFLKLGKISLSKVYIWIFLVVFILLLFLHLLLRRTLFGKMLRATAQNREAASILGININVTTSISFIFSTTFVGIAGILLAPVYFVSLELGGGSIGVKGFASAVMGGLIDPYGTLLGGITIGLVENFSTLFISSTYKDIIAFIVLVLMLILKPTGLFNWTSKEDN